MIRSQSRMPVVVASSALVVSFALVTLVASGPTVAAEPPARTALDDYIAREDPAFEWKKVSEVRDQGVVFTVLDVTSQSWLSPKDVNRTKWQHWITVVRPERVTSSTAFLVIGGGSNESGPPTKPSDIVTALAVGTGAVVAELRMIPNQPLTFNRDGKERVEDDLIAHAWTQFLATGRTEWLPRFPMVKSAVRAMDCLQAHMKKSDVDIGGFVVAGGSKRGWTTWLTGLDSRVRAIIPIVIDVLNVVPSMDHHYAAYGFWAPAVGDYTREGIQKQRLHPRYRQLLGLVDPYSYRHRLTLPKLVVNSSGDQYFLPDSAQFYFGELVGPKHLRYVPNTDHSLDDSDVAETLEAYFVAIASGKKLPELSWSAAGDDGLRVKTSQMPKEVRLWRATNPEARDFRLEAVGKIWESDSVSSTAPGTYAGRVDEPEKGWTAFFLELTYDGYGRHPLKLTTEVRVVPDVLPHADKLAKLKAELEAERAKRRKAALGGGQ